jgi:hypothetical protein
VRFAGRPVEGLGDPRTHSVVRVPNYLPRYGFGPGSSLRMFALRRCDDRPTDLKEEAAMELAFAVLADGATARPDGKLDLFGAGFEQVGVHSLPARHAHLTLVLRLLLGFEEAAAAHQLHLDVVGPDGATTIPTLRLPVQVPAEHIDAVPQEQTHVTFNGLLNIEDILFHATGPHDVVVRWDGRELQRITITVVKAEATRAAA